MIKILSDFLQMVQERAESPKALSPGQRPGYASNQHCALQGQNPLLDEIKADFEKSANDLKEK